MCCCWKDQVSGLTNTSISTRPLKNIKCLAERCATWDTPCVCLPDHTIKRTKEKPWRFLHLTSSMIGGVQNLNELDFFLGVCCPAVAPDARLPCETCRQRGCALPAVAATQPRLLRRRRSCRPFPSRSFCTCLRDRPSRVCASGLAFGFAPN